MPAQTLYLPDSPHGLAFRALADWLQSDPLLKGAVNKWRAWEGNKPQDDLPASIAQLPWVRLTPEMGPIEPYAIRQGVRSWASPLDVTVEAAVGGSLAEDSMRLWNAVFYRVLAWTPEARRAVGVCDVRPAKPAQTINDLDYTIGKGAVRLDMYVR